MGRVLAEDFGDDPDADDCLLVEGVSLSHGNQSVQVCLVDEDVAFQDGADEDGHASEVFVVPASQNILDVSGNG